jgi:hypothetical protein
MFVASAIRSSAGQKIAADSQSGLVGEGEGNQ